MVVMAGVLSVAGFIVVVACAARALRFAFNIWRMKRLTRNVPGPPGYPIIGNILDLTGDPDHLYDRVSAMCTTYRPTGKIWLGPELIVVIVHPDDIEAVCKNPMFHKSHFYKAIEPLMGKGLITISGKKWREHRKAITPSLHLDILADFVGVFASEGAMFVDRLGRLADDGKDFDIVPLCGYCANTTVCKSVMSLEDTGEEADREEFVAAIDPGLDLCMYRIWRPWFLNDWLFSWTKKYQESKRVQSTLDTFIGNMIKRKIKEIKQTEQGSSMDRKPRRRQAFLDHVLSSQEGAVLSQDELFEEVKTFVAAASTTSKDALGFVLLCMALRQDLQDKVHQEIKDVLGTDTSREVTYLDLPHLQYLERFIKEVLRYFPTIAMIARHCPEDFKLPSGFIAPRGCQIGMFLPSTHHDPSNFPEPEKFDPDRFLSDNSRGRHPFSYIPFSAGHRNCIGQRYGMMFLKTVVATLVRKVRFLPALDGPQRIQDVKLRMELTLTVRGGMVLRVQRRGLVSLQ